MKFVLDASATLPWCFQDEATDQTNQLLHLAYSGADIHVPQQWPMEILNGLTRSARRGRIPNTDIDQFLLSLLKYNITIAKQTMELQWTETKGLILKHRLSYYDAAYLALAIRPKIGLATFDDQLRLAAIAERVSLIV